MALPRPYSYEDPDAIRRRIASTQPLATDTLPGSLGAVAQAPSAGNAYGAIKGPTLDPTRRPDVLNADGSHSSLLSGSDGTDDGELLYPAVTPDGRILDRDAAFNRAIKTGENLGTYSTPDMATQAGIAMHNYAAEQGKSPGFQPTMRTRADTPGVQYDSAESQARGGVGSGRVPGAASPAEVGADQKARLQQTLDDPAFGDYVTANQKPDKGWQVLDAVLGGLQGKQYDKGYWDQNAKQFDDANLKDPHSEESHKMRAANAPMLQQLGLQPDEIAHLSGADIAQVSKGGNLVEGLLTARQKAQQAKVEAERKAAEDARAGTEFDRRAGLTGDTAEAKLERSNVEAKNRQELEASREAAALERAKLAHTPRAGTGGGGGGHAMDAAEQQRLNDYFKGAVPTEVQARFDALGTIPAKQRGSHIEAFWKDLGVTHAKNDAATAKAGAGDAVDTAVLDWEKANPGFYVSDPGVWHKAIGEGRGVVKYRDDLQQAHILNTAANDLLKYKKQWDDNSALAHPLDAVTIKASYDAAADKAVGAQTRLSNENDKDAREHARGKIPSIVDPTGWQQLKGRAEVYNHVIDARMHGTYGVSQGARKAGAAQQAAPTAKGGGGLVHVKFKDGTEHDLPPEIAQRAREAGDAI